MLAARHASLLLSPDQRCRNVSDTIVEIQLPSGVTSTLSLYADGNDALANSDGADTLTESLNRKGLYAATVTEALAGLYFAKILVGSNVLATGWIKLADDDGPYSVVDDKLTAEIYDILTTASESDEDTEYNLVPRSLGDETPINLQWPTSPATIVVEFWNGTAYVAATATASATGTPEGDKFIYRLSNWFEDADAVGAYRFKLSDGAVTRYLPVVVNSGGGGGVLPLFGVVESRVVGTTINVFTNETPTIYVSVVDASGSEVDIESMSLAMIIEMRSRDDIVVIADSDITKDGSAFSFVVPSAATDSEGLNRWTLRNTGDGTVLMHGPFVVSYAADEDS